ncbi:MULTISPECIES: restriction endonuclease subunit S [unclassified Micromonospora]|uniref:restriction endonuclease subunit S n=1 Tax=unclassified Micromonospora TaxID=2617518 RepID=UPI00331D4CDC
MSLTLDKSGWKRVALGDVIRHVTDRVDPETSGLERFLAGEHIPSNSLHIKEWGVIGRDPIGPMFYKRFRPGHVLYVSRRSYLRKTAVPEFEGITGEKTFVLETRDQTVLLQEFMPFLLSAEAFHSYAVANSRGSVNPYINWTDLANYQFDLPPLQEQVRLAELLWAVERNRLALVEAGRALASAESIWTRDAITGLDWSLPLVEAVSNDRPLCYGVVQPGVEAERGVGLVRVMDLESGNPSRRDLKRISPEVDLQYRRSKIVAGDVLVSIVGTIGRTWVVTDEFEGCNIARALARISPNSKVMLPDFLAWVLSSDRLQSTLLSAAFESARKTLNLSVLSNVLLPRISVLEQKALLNRRADFLVAKASVGVEVAAISKIREGLLVEIFGDAT